MINVSIDENNLGHFLEFALRMFSAYPATCVPEFEWLIILRVCVCISYWYNGLIDGLQEPRIQISPRNHHLVTPLMQINGSDVMRVNCNRRRGLLNVRRRVKRHNWKLGETNRGNDGVDFWGTQPNVAVFLLRSFKTRHIDKYVPNVTIRHEQKSTDSVSCCTYARTYWMVVNS